MTNEVIVMVGPSLQSRGGIASVVCAYEHAGLFSKWPIIYLNSHVEGSKVKKLLAAFTALKTFAGLLVVRRVKVLHIHVARNTSFWRKSIFILFAYAAKCPVIVHLHSGGFPEFYWNKCDAMQKRVVRFILDHADRIIVLSSQWWGLLDGMTQNTRITKIPNFIIEVENEPAACEREKNSVLFLGRLSTEKGFFDLLEAAAIVRQRIPGFKLQCGGVGDINEVMARIKKLGMEDNIELLGWVEDEERRKLLNRTAAFVLPSYIEGVPMGILEAMAAGVPVISTTVGGIPEVIDCGVDGILMEPGDINALANAIASLLRNAEMRVDMGVAARQKIAQRFSAEKVLPQLEAIYRSLGAVPADAATRPILKVARE